MLVARNEGGQFFNAWEDTINREQDLFCPACSGAVRFKKGQIMRPHFAHIALEGCRFYTENESAEHLHLKAGLYAWGRQDQAVQIEAFLPDLQQVADLLVGERLALEVQCSPLPQQRLRERTESYRRHGYQVRWLLGRKLWLKQSLTALQKDLLYFSQNMGFHLWELDEERQQLRLKYLIHEDLHGRAQYKERLFPFSQGSLLHVLRTPFLRQEMESFLGQPDPDICRYVRQQLYYQQSKWMKIQAELYQQGDNLLSRQAADFYPQIQPVKGISFCQIEQDLTSYYHQFACYYQMESNKERQILYPPVFYRRISSFLMVK